MTSPGSRWFPVRPSRTRSTPALWAKSLLNAVLFFGVFMILLPWGAHRLAPLPVPLPAGLAQVAAAVLFVGGLVVWGVCLDVFSRRGRGTPLPVDAPRNLVCSGPFAYVRNPIMAAELAVIWGEGLYFGSAGVLGYAAAVTLLAHLLVVQIEEPELRARFGEAYVDYCRRVPRWLPRIGRGGRRDR